MGILTDSFLEEIPDEILEGELKRRKMARETGFCSYCGKSLHEKRGKQCAHPDVIQGRGTRGNWIIKRES